MKLITTLPYSKTKFKFAANHYDLHLNGTCIYENKLCEFKTIVGDWNEEKDEWDESFCEIYTLTFFEKIEWIWRQWCFETCVGHHWSYKDGKRGASFSYRNPKWLYELLFKLYFNMKI